MFSHLRLFNTLACPDKPSCSRPSCIFSHSLNLPSPPTLALPIVHVPRPQPPQPSASSTLPAKRPVVDSPPSSPAKNVAVQLVPPRKFQKAGTSRRPVAVPSASHTETGVPVLRVNAAQSQVALPVRQTMLKTIYDHYLVLYKDILTRNPLLASEHALKQEEEVYKKSTKLTYRNAAIQCVAAIKRRSIPNSGSHPSVGTEDEILARAEAQKALQSTCLSADLLESLIHPLSDLEKWGYFIEMPPGPGGDQPSMEGKIAKCERCTQYFTVKAMQDADTCIYHWGKPSTTRANGEKIRIFTCCSRPVADSEGCCHGPHVFYESTAQELHSRHAFTHLVPVGPTRTALDVAAMDCEMVYSTGGLRVARVSVVDGSGAEVFDQLIRMDDGIQIIDFNTRFSGINAENYATAVNSLASTRDSLNSLIDASTILIGHALDNDLKTMRIIHNRCIDTALLFPHRAGAPYRRSLKDLVREKLGKLIQIGGATEGHSSVEDASATLDLVRWYILNTQKISHTGRRYDVTGFNTGSTSFTLGTREVDCSS